MRAGTTETQGYETGRGRQMPLMGRSQPFLSDEHGQQMSTKRQTSPSVLCHKEGNRLHISQAFHLQNLHSYSLNNLGECCTLQAASGPRRQVGIFHSLPEELRLCSRFASYSPPSPNSTSLILENVVVINTI